MKRLGEWIQSNWMIAIVYGLVAGSVGGLVWYKIASLLPGMSAAEISHYGASATIDIVAYNPLYLPQKFLQLSGLVVGLQPVHALRLASTLFGICVIAALYYVLKVWYSRRIAFFGATLFATSSWFLFTVRNGATPVLYSCLFLAFACAVWIQQSRASMKSIAASAAVLVCLLYVPGMVWLIVPIFLWRLGWIRSHVKSQNKPFVLILMICAMVMLAPLFMAMYRQPDLLRLYLGLPESLPSIQTFATNIARVPVHIFVQNPLGFETHLSSLPHVGWSLTLLTLVGAYAYIFKRKLDRTWTLGYIFLISIPLIALGGPVHISVLLPFVFLIATGGVALMLQQWFTVFPHNPFARTVGVGVVICALAATSFYSINQYFVAWPHTPETKQVFRYRP